MRKSQNMQTNVFKQETSQVTISVCDIRTLGWELQLRSHGAITPFCLSEVQGTLRNSSSPGGEKISQMKNYFPGALDNVLAVLAQTAC